MRYFSLCLMLALFACNRSPMVAPATLQTTWIDAATHNDTIITNLDNHSTLLYYAQKNWQQSADTSLSHGYRFIAIRYKDSIMVKEVDDVSTNYDGPFLLETNEKYDTLRTQNFLDATTATPAKTYILLH